MHRCVATEVLENSNLNSRRFVSMAHISCVAFMSFWSPGHISYNWFWLRSSSRSVSRKKAEIKLLVIFPESKKSMTNSNGFKWKRYNPLKCWLYYRCAFIGKKPRMGQASSIQFSSIHSQAIVTYYATVVEDDGAATTATATCHMPDVVKLYEQMAPALQKKGLRSPPSSSWIMNETSSPSHNFQPGPFTRGRLPLPLSFC